LEEEEKGQPPVFLSSFKINYPPSPFSLERKKEKRKIKRL
jgi:hypothetical protein